MTQTPPQPPYQQPNQQQYQQPYQQPYPQQPYYGPPANLPAAPGAQTSMICGIIACAIGCTGLILGPIAISNGKKAKALIAARPMQYGGGGMATAGYVMGIIATIWGGFWALYLLVVLGVVCASSGM